MILLKWSTNNTHEWYGFLKIRKVISGTKYSSSTKLDRLILCNMSSVLEYLYRGNNQDQYLPDIDEMLT